MGVSPFEILVGPAEVYLAATGTAFPAIGATPSASWYNLGKTDGETQVTIDQNINPIYADQVTGALKAVRTRESIMVGFNLIELTLETFKRLLNNATITANAGDKEMTLYQGVDVSQFAMLLRVDSAYVDGNGQWELPVVIQTEAPQVSFTREDKSVLSCKWMTLEDPNAATDSEKFGVLRMAI